MPQEELRTRSPEETLALGRRLGKRLAKGGVVSLVGPLGAGKTLLAKGVFAALGVDPARVTSPTFTLVNRYRAAPPPALWHVDLYRSEGEADLESLGLDEILDSDAVVLVEWGEKLPARWARPDWRVTIEDLGGEERRVVIEDAGAAA